MTKNVMNEKTQFSIGTLLDEDLGRDAVHIAIVPVSSNEKLAPGQDVALAEGSVDMVSVSGKRIGIVDPFLKSLVFPGQRFWLFLYPNTITSLRHEWTHPDFEPGRISVDDHVVKSRAWIDEHANVLGLSADVLMENAADWLQNEKYFVQQGGERWRDNFNPTEFWHHYEIVSRVVVEGNKKENFYCCSC